MKPQNQDLFKPLRFANGLQVNNRVALAPMTHYSSYADGTSNPAEFPYIRRRSGGPSLVLTAAYAITDDARGYHGEPMISADHFLNDLRQVADNIKSQGALAIVQLHHGGSVCPLELMPEGETVAPSAIAIPERSESVPRELTHEEILGLIKAFGAATHRAIKAGFDGVELHGAFGYLLQQFISPFSNRRSDQWGGTQEKRFAFPLAVIKEVQQVVAHYADRPFLVGYRFTPEEPLQPGLTMADALVFTEALVNSGVDFIDVLVNDYRSRPRAGLADLTQRRLQLISQQIAGRTILLGGGAIFTADEAADALACGLDMITLARAMIIDPEWVEKVQQGREEQIITTLSAGSREQLEIPEPFWQVIWSAPGWFPGTLQV
ncbi:MAG: NADH-dependent flavin oxidoreductase [Enterobacteriaceae bacterium]